MNKDQYLKELIELLTEASIDNRYSLVVEYEKQIDQILGEQGKTMKDVINQLGTPIEIVQSVKSEQQKEYIDVEDIEIIDVDPEVKEKAKKTAKSVNSQYQEPFYKNQNFINTFLIAILIFLCINVIGSVFAKGFTRFSWRLMPFNIFGMFGRHGYFPRFIILAAIIGIITYALTKRNK